MSYCEFKTLTAGSVCVVCGWKLPRDFPTGLVRQCPVQVPPCPYLGSPREETVTLSLLCGCKAKRTRTEKTLVVYDCAVQGRCLPGYSCTRDAATEDVIAGEWAVPCRGCPKRP